jgi:hypothetical protein
MLDRELIFQLLDPQCVKVESDFVRRDRQGVDLVRAIGLAARFGSSIKPSSSLRCAIGNAKAACSADETSRR